MLPCFLQCSPVLCVLWGSGFPWSWSEVLSRAQWHVDRRFSSVLASSDLVLVGQVLGSAATEGCLHQCYSPLTRPEALIQLYINIELYVNIELHSGHLRESVLLGLYCEILIVQQVYMII